MNKELFPKVLLMFNQKDTHWIDRRRNYVPIAAHRRSNFGVQESEAAHDLGLPVGMGQEEGDGRSVGLALLVGEDAAASAVASFVVVVVDEG